MHLLSQLSIILISFNFELCVNDFLIAAEEIKELWAEYENNASLEANLVKDFDKVCIIWAFKLKDPLRS